MMPNNKTHENMRFRTMTLEQLYTRLYKITDKQKLTNFIECCTLPGYDELGQSARERYRSLFSEPAPITNSVQIRARVPIPKSKPIKPTKNLELKKPVDFIDILPKRKLRLD